MKTKEDVRNMILTNLKYTSPTHLASEYGINQKIALEVCEKMEELGELKKVVKNNKVHYELTNQH